MQTWTLLLNQIRPVTGQDLCLDTILLLSTQSFWRNMSHLVVELFLFLKHLTLESEESSHGQNEVHVEGQTEPVLAVVGDDVILPCTVRNTVRTVNAVEEAVEWQRPDLNPIEVHFLRNRVANNADQNPSYRGRTSLFKEEMKNGNVSLKLTRVKRSDDGIYICYIPTLQSPNQKGSVRLIVAAASTPNVSILGFDPMGLVLKCEAGGLIHTPEMIWLDSDGTVLPADGSTETGTDSEDRYTVRGHVTVQKTDNNTFTCRVQQQKINHMMETQINVPEQVYRLSEGGPVAEEEVDSRFNFGFQFVYVRLEGEIAV
ncbi:hypothetical protein DPEC_G00367900 [Dallia pectoralis]|nr:hypothetical protein DPEC_G00367900 [Dallia pectoralis]